MPENGVFKVFIVDDNVATLQYLKYLISRHSPFSVSEAYDAEGAFLFLEKNTPDIILLDINLPGMNGLKICEILKKKDPTIPIIMITGELDPENRFLAYRAGANDFIMKPFSASDILSHIRHHLHLSLFDTPTLTAAYG